MNFPTKIFTEGVNLNGEGRGQIDLYHHFASSNVGASAMNTGQDGLIYSKIWEVQVQALYIKQKMNRAKPMAGYGYCLELCCSHCYHMHQTREGSVTKRHTTLGVYSFDDAPETKNAKPGAKGILWDNFQRDNGWFPVDTDLSEPFTVFLSPPQHV